jgi:hypothetical protein
MDFKKFNEIAELFGIVAIVASLVFVGMQLRQSQRIALAEVEATFATASIEMVSLMSENQEIWYRGISNEELDASEEPVFEAIVTAFSDKVWALQSQYELLDDDLNAEGVVHEFAAFLHARPGARRVWLEREAELTRARGILNPDQIEQVSTFVETIKEDLAKLDREGE